MKLTTKLLRKLIKEELEKMDEATFTFGNPNTMPGRTIAGQIENAVSSIWATKEYIEKLKETQTGFHNRMQKSENDFLNNALMHGITEIEEDIGIAFEKINKAQSVLDKNNVSYEDEIAKYEE